MKYALVTGGSGGIGREICLKLSLDHTYHVLVNYNQNKKAAVDTVQRVQENGGSAEIIRFNVEKKEEVELTLKKWEKANKDPGIEVIVNNAGIIKDGLFMFMEEDNWDRVLDVKLKGFYNVTRCVIQKMILNRFGRIVNIASVSGLGGNPGQVNYAAANGGLIAATKALASEVGKKNITVNAIAPGFIRTEMTRSFKEEELKKIIPANRFGNPEEVADLVSFLVSKKAAYINGEVIRIDGGMA